MGRRRPDLQGPVPTAAGSPAGDAQSSSPAKALVSVAAPASVVRKSPGERLRGRSYPTTEAPQRIPDADQWTVQRVALESIDADHLRRDRMHISETGIDELKTSIALNGVRNPVELTLLPMQGEQPRYGLISGWRRLRATRMLWAETGDPRFATLPARVLQPASLGAAYAAMVEENEIRADLSHYERGRIAVLAAEDGVFPSVDAAVGGLFPAASKAKRSKIRSFALVHEALGDVLQHGPALGERAGLRIAAAIRSEATGALRTALESAGPRDGPTELELLERALADTRRLSRDQVRPGRPRNPDAAPAVRQLDNGMVLAANVRGRVISLRLEGPGVDDALLATLIAATLRAVGG